MKVFALLCRICLSIVIGCVFSLHAVAQEDIPYFRNLLRQQQALRQLKANSEIALPVTKRRADRVASGACDVGVNGDFETQITPPTYLNNIGGGYRPIGAGATNAPDQLANWFSPTGGSPDYWADNAGTPGPGGPDDLHPGQDMHPGQAVYGPFIPHSPGGALGLYYNASSNVAAEYARVSFPALTQGKYYAEYWVSLTQNRNICTASIKDQRFGMALGLNTITSGNRSFLPPPPASKCIYSGPIGSRYTNYATAGRGNWKRVSGLLDLNGETTLTLGMFSTNSNGNASDFDTLRNVSLDRKVYVFLDDVAIYKIPTAGPPTTCTSGYVSVGEGCPIPGAKYDWHVLGQSTIFASSTTTITTSVNTSGTYVLTVTLPDNSVYETSVVVNGCTPVPTVGSPTVTGTTPTGAPTGGSTATPNSPGSPNNLCPNACLTYTSNNGSVIWTTSPAGFFTTQSGYGSTFSTCVASSAAGVGTVTATFYNTTGNQVTTSTVVVPDLNATATQYGRVEDNCYSSAHFTINNFSPYVYYTINRGRNNPTPISVHPNTANFLVKVTGGTPDATFTITATGCGGTVTSEEFTAYFDCNETPTTTRTEAAYPNPVAESLSVPGEALNAVLVDAQGKILQQAVSGHLDVQKLPNGLYNLRMTQRGKVVNQRIQVQH